MVWSGLLRTRSPWLRGAAMVLMDLQYPDEFLEQAIREVRTTGRPIAHVAKDLGIHKEALRGWVRQAEADRGERDDRPSRVLGRSAPRRTADAADRGDPRGRRTRSTATSPRPGPTSCGWWT
ncbi:transposase [Streptomyces sp. NPDC005476]|uniref:transposase n=1 Tax=Streptomyces sp. NPDC005476 TaxID=3156882 RepID=UPI0034521459